MPIQRAALLVLTTALVVLGFFILRHFLPALAWAGVLAIGTWPLYTRFRRLLPPRLQPSFWAPLAFTLLVGIVFILPLSLFAIEVGRETLVLVHQVNTIEQIGMAPPGWLAHLPLGSYAVDWWQRNLSNPEAAHQLIGRVNRSVVLEWTRDIGLQLLGRSTILVFTLLALFFLYRDGLTLARQLGVLAARTFGPPGERLGGQVIAAVRGTVDGLVLVGLGEGLLLGVGYAVLGVPQAVLLGALTCVLAMIPFGAPVIFGLAALFLLAQSGLAPAVGLAAYGVIVTFIADHFVRPALIGGAVRLPFLWVLLGILGGVETFGLLGLFLGPAVMAVLVALWREWTAGEVSAPAQSSSNSLR
jgi:predicted PurR-regulated permease PerM